MRRVPVRTLILLLAPTPCVGQEDSVAHRWNQIVATLPSNAETAARALNDAYARHGIPLTYWVRPGLPDSALADLTVFDHPCGVSALAQARTIPPSDARLEAERMVEVDSTGRERRRWPVPIDQWPQGVRGDELLISLHVGRRHDLALAITIDGRYRVVALPEAPVPEAVSCPPHRGFRDSAYARCVAVGRHFLAFEGPCT